MDATVGRIRETLSELKIADRTIIIFTSDNGGRVPTTSNAPLRVGKGSCYEGGVRVPLIVYWPQAPSPGKTCDVPTITMDLYPTLLEMLNQQDAAGHACDGVSLVPLLRVGVPASAGPCSRQAGDVSPPSPEHPNSEFQRALFWHYPHYQHYQQGGTTPYGAIRRGEFKLIEFFDDFRVELYDIQNDIGEQRNLAAQRPEIVDRLRQELHAWRREVGAQMPARNPQHDPTKPEHSPQPR
jgi:arylsulfatase A-like enzyme